MEISIGSSPKRDLGLAPGASALVVLNWQAGAIVGEAVKESSKSLGELAHIFRDRAAGSRLDPNAEIYRVRWWAPARPGSEGGLFWGVTVIQPGKVGDEYFMTQGHYHANPTRAEFYCTVSGSGLLLQMTPGRQTRAEQMMPGTLHYICGEDAHRVVNTGDTPLVFWACWPSDAGYDYQSITKLGFSMRVVERNGKPLLQHGE